jgi:anaerobic selenocysteine-containing dehydrogenase
MTAWTADPGHDVPEKLQYIYGLMCWGQNPAVGGPSSSFERKALANLDWLVCVDLWETETAAFWKPDGLGGSLGIPGMAPSSIDTEVFMLPAAASYEKEGSVVNSGRWAQWRWKALDPPGQAKDDLTIINELGKRLIALYLADGSVDWRIRYPVALLWWGPYCDPSAVANPGLGAHFDAHGGWGKDYDDSSHPTSPSSPDADGLYHADPHKVAWEYNGYFCPSAGAGATKGTRVNGFFNGTASLGTLQENGGTSSGNWLYCSHYINPTTGAPGSFDPLAPDGNRMAKRDTAEVTRADGKYIGLFSNWSYAWPLNRRIIYNGASYVQTTGYPLAPDKWVIWYDGGWKAGGDVTDGMTTPNARYPFIMLPEGVGKLWGSGREDGPFPEHYEPWETVMTQNVTSQTLGSPTLFAHARPEAYEHPSYHPSETFPVIGTSYRFTEHWQAGQMTRNNPWLCQLQPNTIIELDEVLAGLLGIGNGDMIEVKTARTVLYGTNYFAVACVTKRFKPYSIQVDGAMKTVHHIGTTWHYGYTGLCTGDSANLLTPHIGDANTGIPESKAFICNIRKVGSSTWASDVV